MKKTCAKCKKRKSKSMFYKNKSKVDGYSTRCKECDEDSQTREIRQNKALKFRYNITIKDYQDILVKQNNTCAICRSDQPGYKRKYFCVDHDHLSGKIRGLLCYACNLGLGKFKDNIEHLKSAIKYLENNNEKI